MMVPDYQWGSASCRSCLPHHEIQSLELLGSSTGASREYVGWLLGMIRRSKAIGGMVPCYQWANRLPGWLNWLPKVQHEFQYIIIDWLVGWNMSSVQLGMWWNPSSNPQLSLFHTSNHRKKHCFDWCLVKPCMGTSILTNLSISCKWWYESEAEKIDMFCMT